MLATVLASAGIPLPRLALVVGLERFRASLNVTGDPNACIIMDRAIPTRKTKEEELALARQMEKLQEQRDEDVIVR